MSEEREAPDQTDSLAQNSEASAQSTGPVDVGQSLWLAREERGISVYEASMALKLSPKQVGGTGDQRLDSTASHGNARIRTQLRALP